VGRLAWTDRRVLDSSGKAVVWRRRTCLSDQSTVEAMNRLTTSASASWKWIESPSLAKRLVPEGRRDEGDEQSQGR